MSWMYVHVLEKFFQAVSLHVTCFCKNMAALRFLSINVKLFYFILLQFLRRIEILSITCWLTFILYIVYLCEPLLQMIYKSIIYLLCICL